MKDSRIPLSQVRQSRRCEQPFEADELSWHSEPVFSMDLIIEQRNRRRAGTLAFQAAFLALIVVGLLFHPRTAIAQVPELEAEAEIITLAEPTLPLELRQDEILYNQSSKRGMPLSSTVDDPYGSNGLAPANPTIAPTLGQFQSFSSIAYSQREVEEGSLPEFQNSEGLVTLTRARVGAPILGQAVSFLFGQVMSPPSEDEDGTLLEGIEPEDYWELEPFDSGNEDNKYYWSPHASQVFAVDPGSIEVIWQRRENSGTDEPADAVVTEEIDGVRSYSNYVVIDNHFFKLYPKNYIVSGGAVKTPQKLYWNAGDYDGPDPSIPRARVGAIEFAYSSGFPQTVAEEDAEVIQSGPVGEIVEQRTVWVETVGPVTQIQALNVEGRIFMEILGDLNVDGETRDHLGFEILDVFKQVTPLTVTADLGARLETGADSEDDTPLFDVPVDQLGFLDFVYRLDRNGATTELFAIRETENLNDVLIHWMAEGVEGLLWPYLFTRYIFKWPESVEDYQHFVRSNAENDEDAQLTAVPIALEMLPSIEYQDVFADDSTGQLGAFLGDGTFYTVLSEAHPVHRTLLRLSAAEEVAFERVLSWRDTELSTVERTVVNPKQLSTVIDGGSGLVDNWVNGVDDEDLPFLEGATSVVVSDDYAYVVSSDDDSLSIYEVSSPSSPSLVYTVVYQSDVSETVITKLTTDIGSIGGFNSPVAATITGDTLIVSARSSESVVLFDISTPSAPIFLSRINDTDLGGTGDLDFLDRPGFVRAFGDLLGVGNETNGDSATEHKSALYLFDLSRPTNPALLSRITDGDSIPDSSSVDQSIEFGEGVVEFDFLEEQLFLAGSGNPAVYFLNIVDPKTPTLNLKLEDGVGDYNYLATPRVPTVLAENNLLFVASSGSDDAVTIIDISDLEAPVWKAEIRDGVDGFDYLDAPLSLGVESNVLAVSALIDDAITLIDISSPSQPNLMEQFYQGDAHGSSTLDGANGMSLVDELVYVASNTSDALTIIDAPDPAVKRWDGTDFAGSLAEELDEYNVNRQTFAWPDELTAPRVLSEIAYVGDRIVAPDSELGAGSELDEDEDGEPDEVYWAGHIASGTSYHPDAYLDPFDPDIESGAANLGAIIPVNVFENDDQLTVWWFRENGADTANGFKTIYWPSVVAQYSLAWPEDGREIVLASNDGSGALSSLPAKGSIYFRNTPGEIGYNPNEEHALMQGGQAFALRDDLNLTADDSFSSLPFILVEYTAADDRPAILAFEVLRQKPEDGLTFDFLIDAGTIVQAPMPLPLLDLPIPDDALSAAESLNREIDGEVIESSSYDDTTQLLTLTTATQHVISPFATYLLEDPDSDDVFEYTILDAPDGRTVVGFVTDGSAFDASHKQYASWRINGQTPNAVESVEVFEVADFTPVSPVFDVVFMSEASGSYQVFEVIDSHEGELFARLENSSRDNGFEGAEKGAVISDEGVVDYSGWTITKSLLPNVADESPLTAQQDLYGGFTVKDRKGNLWVYRGPHQDASETDSPSETGFEIQFHYKTLDGFAFPESSTSLADVEVGTITPYLRRIENGAYVGLAGEVEESADGETQALPINYIPVWPSDVPELHMGETLTLSRRELPAIRGNSSLELIYDQALANSEFETSSSVLHDPTREKEYFLGGSDSTILNEIPASAATVDYLGNTFFQNLPPHLGERFFFDPTRGDSGALVLKGEFFEETVGEDYVLSNLLGAGDIEELKELVSDDDGDKGLWEIAVDGLSTRMDVFTEDPDVPGTYIAGEFYDIGVGEVAVVTNDDIAVDSYALTATGPGLGYQSIVAGDGLAFTDEDDPVSILIVKVVEDLHPGELKVVQSSNPLSEKLTLQQVVDLAGKGTEEFTFDWRIAAPVDGLPLDVASYASVNLISEEDWTHLPFPEGSDTPSSVVTDSGGRSETISLSDLVVLETISFDSSSTITDPSGFQLERAAGHFFAEGNIMLLRTDSDDLSYTVDDINGNGTTFDIIPYELDQTTPASLDSAVDRIVEQPGYLRSERVGIPDSILIKEFTTLSDSVYSELWLGVGFSSGLAVRAFVNGEEVVRSNFNPSDAEAARLDAEIVETVAGEAPTDTEAAQTGVSYLVDPSVLDSGTDDGAGNRTHYLVIEVFAYDTLSYDDVTSSDIRLDAIEYLDVVDDAGWLALDEIRYPDGIRAIIGGTADVQALSDNWITMRYGQVDTLDADGDGDFAEILRYSEWADPQLAEGWIKRVLAGINPFNQRTSDFFNNAVDTDSSMLTLAGPRWEGDIALNSDTINDYGLIEIYETVLNRGRGLSIDAGINYGPANDALLLAAGYINDLYTFLGDEAWSDALNPTIGIGTEDAALGDIATALFAFKGQTASLLEEELALLRGRDDFIPPGVEATPVYNRMFWNYTRGIDSGEVVYALNYNIQESQEDAFDGVIDAEDAAVLYPQGHGDAYGHYLTALKGYYSLLIDEDFDWAPRTESVLILGQAVQVDYTDERKFAASAAAVARTGTQVVGLTRRQDYSSGEDIGWEHLGGEEIIRVNDSRGTSRHWGVDHWATRVGQGAFVNWLVGNAILPDVDDDPEHEGIQVVDRQTVPELSELAETGREIQDLLDGAESKLNPLGLTEGSIPFDINPVNPATGGGIERQTHFEQIYERANLALENAVVAFDGAKDVTRTMRSEQNTLEDLQHAVVEQELAYEYGLIELYGTPYSDDIGPGATYETGYEGPDLAHYPYVELPEISFGGHLEPDVQSTFEIDIQDYPDSWDGMGQTSLFFLSRDRDSDEYFADDAETFIEFTLDAHGFFEKPNEWSGRRKTTGKIQASIGDVIEARNRAYQVLRENQSLKYRVDRMSDLFVSRFELFEFVDHRRRWISRLEGGRDVGIAVDEFLDKKVDDAKALNFKVQNAVATGFPNSFIAGLAAGGDLTSGVRAGFKLGSVAVDVSLDAVSTAATALSIISQIAAAATITELEFNQIIPEEFDHEKKQLILEIDLVFQELIKSQSDINSALEALLLAQERVDALISTGDRLQAEREIFRKKTAAAVQGFRTRDAGLRIFRDEKLERYNALFDLAATYTYLAAQAFDYETGLLDTDEGRNFIDRIIRSRALGVTENGKPQFAGSNTGDPGLSSVLAEMDAEWQVLSGRLGFNAPDIDKTTLSLRTENFRILPDSDGDTTWQDVLAEGRTSNLLDDSDIIRHCMRIDTGDGLPVPGIVVEFSTTVADGYNLFGQPLAGGDHAFSPSTFATKIFSTAVALDGYQGMDEPSSTAATVGDSVVSDPTASFLDPNILSATPYIYLVPVGLDSMRSPPLGDASVIRTWDVQDLTVPLPFNIGASEHSTKKLYQSSDSLTEDLFEVRKHQAFGAVPSADNFPTDGRLFPSFFTNNRLVGRSVWNSKWKLVIPGRTLSNNPDQGLDVFIETVKDIILNFETVSYAGN